MARVTWAAGLALGLASGLAAPAAAQRFVGCTGYQEEAAAQAVASAANVARLAAAEVSAQSQIYRFWFGPHDPARAEVVRSTLKRLNAQLLDTRLTLVCEDSKLDCEATFAYVTGTPAVIHLCPDYFRMPSLSRGAAPDAALEAGTREGTIIHEASHFEAVGGTGDGCYERTPCAILATEDAPTAIGTADSLQFFAEDVAFDRAARAVRAAREAPAP